MFNKIQAITYINTKISRFFKDIRKFKMDSKPATEKKPEEQNAEKKEWAEMSDDEDENETAGANEEAETKPEPEPKKIIPPTQKGTKNKQGDYIVEKFEIPDFRDGIKAKK